MPAVRHLVGLVNGRDGGEDCCDVEGVVDDANRIQGNITKGGLAYCQWLSLQQERCTHLDNDETLAKLLERLFPRHPPQPYSGNPVTKKSENAEG